MFRSMLIAFSVLVATLVSSGAANADPCQLTKIADLPVTVTPGNEVLAAGAVDGAEARFLIDTGSYETLFDGTVASRFGTAKFGRDVHNIGAGGEFKVLNLKIPELRIGSFVGRDILFHGASTHFLNGGVAALIGDDFLASFDLDIDLAKGNIGLFAHNRCHAEPVYWSSSFSEADISTLIHHILVSIEINGVRARAVLDTGASRSLISTALARRLGIGPTTPGVTKIASTHGIDMHEIEVFQYQFSELRIGDEVVKNPTLRIANLAPMKFHHESMARLQASNADDSDALIGADFVKAHHLYIAPDQGKMYFTWNGGAIFLPPKEESSGQ